MRIGPGIFEPWKDTPIDFSLYADLLVGWKLKDEVYSYEIEAPGVPRENIQVELEAKQIKVEYKDRRGYAKKLLIEVPAAASFDTIRAEAKDGILTISMDKNKQFTRKIEVK